MNLEKLKEFINIAKTEKVNSLRYEDSECKMEISLGGVAPNYVPPAVSAAPVSNQKNEQSTTNNYQEIKSPFVGTFYASPAPGKPAYVKVGDKISKGQGLCILEAMKIMNEIDSDIDGEIIEICVTNESLVEYGQVLFKVK